MSTVDKPQSDMHHIRLVDGEESLRAVDMRMLQAELERTRELLDRSRLCFANIVEKSVDGVLIISPEGNVGFANESAAALFSRSIQQLVDTDFGLPIVAGDMTEIDIIRVSGEPGVAEMRVQETDWEGKSALLVALRDITDRKRIEAVRLEAERRVMLESTLAAVHHLSQGLAVMYGNLDMLSSSNHLPERESCLIAQCLKGAQKFREIIEKMRNVREYRTTPYGAGALMIDIEPCETK